MNDMQCFMNERFGQVRIVDLDGELRFIAKDVAACIDYKDVSTMCKLCRDKDLSIINGKEYSADLAEYSESRGNPNLTVISESGLYRILAKCNLPKCEPFEQWVFDDVIPSVRKYGVYATPQAIESLDEKELMARALLAAQSTIARVEAERDKAKREKYLFSKGREAQMSGRVGGLTNANLRLKGEIENLKEQIGDSTNWKCARAIPWTKEYFNTKLPNFESILGKNLKKVSIELYPATEYPDYNIHQVEDERHGSINSYHISVISEFKHRLDLDTKKKIMSTFRKA